MVDWLSEGGCPERGSPLVPIGVAGRPGDMQRVADGLTVRLMAVEPMAVNSIFVVEGSQGITRPKVDRAVSRSG